MTFHNDKAKALLMNEITFNPTHSQKLGQDKAIRKNHIRKIYDEEMNGYHLT